MVRKAIIKRILLNKIIVSEAITANKAMINKVNMTNKAKNNVNIYNEHVNAGMQYDKCTKKKENTPI